jgi:hypothetical protein
MSCRNGEVNASPPLFLSFLQKLGPTVKTKVSLNEPARGVLPEKSHENARLAF